MVSERTLRAPVPVTKHPEMPLGATYVVGKSIVRDLKH